MTARSFPNFLSTTTQAGGRYLERRQKSGRCRRRERLRAKGLYSCRARADGLVPHAATSATARRHQAQAICPIRGDRHSTPRVASRRLSADCTFRVSVKLRITVVPSAAKVNRASRALLYMTIPNWSGLCGQAFRHSTNDSLDDAGAYTQLLTNLEDAIPIGSQLSNLNLHRRYDRAST